MHSTPCPTRTRPNTSRLDQWGGFRAAFSPPRGGFDMTVLRDDLIVAALKLLQADGGAGQSPSPEDMLEIDNILDGKLAELNTRGIFYADNNEEFEDQYEDPLATILANAAAPKFGQARSYDSVARAEAVLREMRNSTYVRGSTLTTDYF